jgi:hypothetical protein
LRLWSLPRLAVLASTAVHAHQPGDYDSHVELSDNRLKNSKRLGHRQLGHDVAVAKGGNGDEAEVIEAASSAFRRLRHRRRLVWRNWRAQTAIAWYMEEKVKAIRK